MTLVSDRYKHVAIVASTAGLPAPLRVRARGALLSRLHRAKLERANVLVMVHPKCGGTWLRVMLFRLYQRKYGLDTRRVLKTDELQRLDPNLPTFLVSNGHYSFEGEVEAAFANPGAGFDPDGKKLIFLARHPCDVVVSWWIQFSKRTTAYKRELINHQLRMPVSSGISQWEFAMHDELGVPGLIDYMNTWARHLEQAREPLLVRYEDLRVQPRVELERISTFLGEDFAGDALDEAVEFASFDNLRALEKANYFDNDGLRLRSSGDPDTLKVRRGVVGGYRDHFGPEQVKQLQKLVDERLTPVFGYGSAAGAATRSLSAD